MWLLFPLISAAEFTPAVNLAAQQPEAWLMRAEGISIQNLSREDVPWSWERITVSLQTSQVAPGCHSLITVLSLEQSPSLGLGRPPISPCATGCPGGATGCQS